MFRQLLWKEWRENQWKLIFCAAISLVFSVMLFRIRLFPDWANCLAISFIQMFVVPVIYALDIFSGEMSNRTIHLLFKIPVPRWKIFFSKYLVCILSIISIFLMTSLLMETISQSRETQTGLLLKMNLSFSLTSLLLFTWFCGFGAQSRSEAASLAIIFGIMIGWAIFFFWSAICQVPWAFRLTPYSLINIPEVINSNDGVQIWLTPIRTIASQLISFALILAVACYRFVKVRRYL